MTTASTDLNLAGTIFVAINRALKAEGMNDSEAFRLASRGAHLLAAPETPELEAALRAAASATLPPMTRTAIDNLNRSLNKAIWMTGGLYVYLLAWVLWFLL